MAGQRNRRSVDSCWRCSVSAGGPASSDLLLDGARGDGLLQRPLDGLGKPRVAGESDFGGSGVDAFDEFVGDADGHLLHTGMVAGLITDSGSDSVSVMTWIGKCSHCKTIARFTEKPAAQYVRCPKCRIFTMYTKPLVARVTEKRCDARCSSATSSECNCSCGGRNHGVDHHWKAADSA